MSDKGSTEGRSGITKKTKASSADRSEDYLANIQDDDYDEEVAKKRQRQLASKVCQDMCCFGLFLAAFTIVALAANSPSSAYLVARTQSIIDRDNNTTPLAAVNSIDSFWNYMDGFLDDVFENNTDTDMAYRLNPKLQPLDASNRLLGAIQLKQVRVAGESCAGGGSMMFSA